MTTRLIALLLVLTLVALPAGAWNLAGHRIIAAIAYDRLTPAAKVKVDQLLSKHPDYGTLLTATAPADPSGRARAAFIAAAAWPDMIRGDVRFYDETRKDYVITPLLPGFPTMSRHVTWHYYDLPYAPDGAPKVHQAPPHALSELRRMLATIAQVMPQQATYDLPWLEHLVGDVHQPLHATSRSLKIQPMGDAGGNFVFVPSTTNPPSMTLHAFWDNSAGTDMSDAYVDQYAAQVAREIPAPGNLRLNPKRWLKESLQFDKSDVYTFGLVTGSREQPVTLPPGYEDRAKKIARERIALAGYRLAAVLNQRFR